MADNFTKKELIAILVIILTLIFGLAFKFLPKDIFISEFQSKGFDNMHIASLIEENGQEEKELDFEIMVHISGQVKNPGLIILKNGQRLVDAVELAGGLEEEADLDRINLAKKLRDEDKIYIPAFGEEEFYDSIYIFGQDEKGKININRCDKEQLLSLPGIGEVIANRIIDYREKTPFTCVEDLFNVLGIGDRKFEEIKDLVIVN